MARFTWRCEAALGESAATRGRMERMDTLEMNIRDPAQEEVDTRTLLRQAQRQAQQRHYEDFLIVDVDAHHYETESFSQIIEFVEDPVVRHIARAKTGATTS